MDEIKCALAHRRRIESYRRRDRYGSHQPLGKTQGRGLNSPENLVPFLPSLRALTNLLTRFEEQGIIIGGIAVSLLGKPRLTADLDAIFLLSVDQIPSFLETATQEGIFPRIENAEEFARKNRILLLQHEESGINIDISLGILPFEKEAVDRGQLLNIGSLTLRLPTPEDLIILKAVAHRPKDMLDIQAIIDNFPEMNRHRIEFWVHQFAEALEMPEIWADLNEILAQNQ